MFLGKRVSPAQAAIHIEVFWTDRQTDELKDDGDTPPMYRGCLHRRQKILTDTGDRAVRLLPLLALVV